MILKETYTMHHGRTIPKLGFGTWQIKDGEEAYQSTLWALKHGYRHIDTAAAYRNEESIGRAIKDSRIPREQLFITTKLQSHIKGYYSTFVEFNRSMKRLGLDYIDLYLIHAPWPWEFIGVNCVQGNIDSWAAMEEILAKGTVKSIGVSNFEIHDLEPLLKVAKVVPHVNQIPFWIGRPQNELRDFCKQKGILVEAYSPLATGRIFQLPILDELAKKYKRTQAQIAIRYTLEMGTLPLPKSTKEVRILENSKLDFKLSSDDVGRLHAIVHEFGEDDAD